MKNKYLFGIALLALSCIGCGGHQHGFEGQFVVTTRAYKRTYFPGEDFNPNGMTVCMKCKSCGEIVPIKYTLENNTELEIDQESVTINYRSYSLEYGIKVKAKQKIACIGDSLTAGHMWASESYPSKLSALVDSKYEVGNYGVNGISITGYGGSWDDPEKRYIKQDVYQNSVNFAPDILAIMLGTNDATGWANAKDTFDEYYHILLDSYLELFPMARYIMMVSPPCVTPNQFGIPNDVINDEINPRQRDLADEYGFEMLDLREEFEANENFASEYLRPNNDNVHFTSAGASFVAGRVWDIIKN